MQTFLLLTTVALYATAKKKAYKDDSSEEVNVNVQHRLKPFIRALEEFVQEQKVNKWFDEARRKRHGAYINEFGPLILDVIGVVDTRKFLEFACTIVPTENDTELFSFDERRISVKLFRFLY